MTRRCSPGGLFEPPAPKKVRFFRDPTPESSRFARRAPAARVDGPLGRRVRVARRRRWALVAVVLVAVAPLAAGCPQSTKSLDPDQPRVLHVYGTHYEMGYQIGQAYSSEIRQVFTQFLTASLIPYFSRQQPSIASVLPYYADPRFENGQFALEFLKEAAHGLEPFIPQRFRDEIRGISDGSGYDYENVLILNTLLDSVLSLVNITVFLQILQSPVIDSITLPESLNRDGIDNGENGLVDEPNENVLSPFPASPFAVVKGMPPQPAITFRMHDVNFPNVFGPEGVDLSTLRVRFNDDVYTQADTDVWSDNGDAHHPVVTVKPRNPFPDGTAVAVDVEAADLDQIEVPPPLHPNVARLQRFTFIVGGATTKLEDVGNERPEEASGSIPAWNLAVRKSVTTDGSTLVARAQALLDIDVLHKFTTLVVHHPTDDQGNPEPSFTTVGYTGVGWSLTGMNDRGIVVALDRCETFDDSVVGHIFKEQPYHLNPQGALGPWMAREILEDASSLDDAERVIRRTSPATGWNFLLTDGPHDDMRVVEIDADIDGAPDHGYYTFGADPSDPGNLDAKGRPLASVTPDDLRNTIHYVKNLHDAPDSVPLPLPLDLHLPDQRNWGTTYFSSVSIHAKVGEALAAAVGHVDAQWLRDLESQHGFYDPQISMHDVVFAPDSLEFWVAMGRLPAVGPIDPDKPDGPQVPFNHFGPELFTRPAP